MTTMIPIPDDRLAWLAGVSLAGGAHDDVQAGVCAMEAAAYLAGEPHSDRPACVSPVIAAFCRSWNDALSDADRDRLLKPVVPLTIGTRTTPADEETRAWLATDWLARVQAPAWLRLAGLEEHARALESCARIVDATTARAAQPTLDAARSASAAAWAAARDAAWDATWDTTWAAAWDATWDTTWAAARAATWAAARDAARAATWAAAWAAARAAARAATWAAARDAARDAARAAARAAAWAAARAAARDAAWAAARDAATGRLAPTVAALQESAVELVRALCAVGRATEAADAPRR